MIYFQFYEAFDLKRLKILNLIHLFILMNLTNEDTFFYIFLINKI